MPEWPPCPLLRNTLRFEKRGWEPITARGAFLDESRGAVLQLAGRAPALDVQRPAAAGAGRPRHGERRDRAVPDGPAAVAAHGVLAEPLVLRVPALERFR